MSRPILALLTDFGAADHYVAAMKAVALAICSEAAIVDITHEVPAHDVEEGAYQLVACYRYFPAGTVFVAVVDPDVGAGRRAIAARAGEWMFVGPDNGLFSHVFVECPPDPIVELSAAAYALPAVSRTFEGRDRFAPAAAWLARGTALAALGSVIHDPVRLPAAGPLVHGDRIEGAVIHIDRFGNVVTNIGRAIFHEVFGEGRCRIAAGGHAIDALVRTYAECPPGQVCALFGSTDRLELAANRGRAAALVGARRGTPVVVTR